MGKSRTRYAFEPGETIPNSPYEIRTFLGAGGHGAVFLAQDHKLRLPVVVKVLHPEFANTSAADRLRREGQALAALGRLNGSFAAVLRSDDALIRLSRPGGLGAAEVRVPYFVMDFINGPRLRDLVATSKRKKQPLAIEMVLTIAQELAKALSHVHAAKMVHRDIKPDNIMFHLRERDTPALRIIDFGVIDWSDGPKGERDHGFQGTVKYAAPEQLAERPVSAATDLYALGVVLFELLTGCVPFDGDEAAVMQGHMRVTPPSILQFRPDAPPALADIVAALLAKEPERRTRWLVARGAPLDAATMGVEQVLGEICREVQSQNAFTPSLAALLKDVSWRGRADTTNPGRSSGSARRRLSGDTPVDSHDVTAPPLDSLLSGLDAPVFELNRLDRLGPPAARARPADATDPSMGPPVTAPMDWRPVLASVDINKTEEQPIFPHTLPLGLPAFQAEHVSGVAAANLPSDAPIEASARSAEDAEDTAPSSAPSTGVDTPPPRRLYTTSDVLDAIDEAIDELWEDDTQWREPLSAAEATTLLPERDILHDPFFVSDSPTVTSERSAKPSASVSAVQRHRRIRNASIGVTATAAAFTIVAFLVGGHRASWSGASSSASTDSLPAAVAPTTPPPSSASIPSTAPTPTSDAPEAPSEASAVAPMTAPVASVVPRAGRPQPRGFAFVGAEPGASKPLGTTSRPPPSNSNDVGEFKTHVDH